MTGAADRVTVKRERGAKARREGRGAEVLAALWLTAKGWRVIGLRVATPQAEIDLIARRGHVLAVVEVKRRQTTEAALGAVSHSQRTRLRAAAANLAARRKDLAGLAVRLDLVALSPRALPRHIPDAWPDSGARWNAP